MRLFILSTLLCTCCFGQAISGGVKTSGGVSDAIILAQAPSFSPNPAFFFVGGSVSITITDGTPGAYVCYATSPTVPVPDGSGGCTVGTLYSTPLSESSTLTLNAVAGATGFGNSVLASVVVAQSALVAQWKMADGSGATSTDSCCGNNLTITPGTGSWTTLGGVANGVYNFDGTATLMNAANSTNVNFNFNQPFSIFAVLEFTGTSNYEAIVDRENWASNRIGYGFYVGFETPNYNAEFMLFNNSSTNALQVYCSNPHLTPGTLYDLLVTYDGSHVVGGVNFYINGTVCAAKTTLFNTLTTTTTNSIVPRVGASSNSTPAFFFKNDLGPVYIWNRVLTSGEDTTLHGNFYAVIN